jgi:hypothetical protein
MPWGEELKGVFQHAYENNYNEEYPIMKTFRVTVPAIQRVEEIHTIEALTAEAAVDAALREDADEWVDDPDYYEVQKGSIQVEEVVMKTFIACDGSKKGTPMTVMDALTERANRRGWDQNTQIDLLCRFKKWLDNLEDWEDSLDETDDDPEFEQSKNDALEEDAWDARREQAKEDRLTSDTVDASDQEAEPRCGSCDGTGICQCGDCTQQSWADCLECEGTGHSTETAEGREVSDD